MPSQQPTIPDFLCDEMLKGLGHWLRAAGYDTVIAAPGTRDRLLIEQANAEHRYLITRDRKLQEFRHAAEVVLLLKSNSLDEWVAELSTALPMNWMLEPFSRCLLCNTLLQSADPSCLTKIPPHSRQNVSRLLYCTQCNKLYWVTTNRKDLNFYRHY